MAYSSDSLFVEDAKLEAYAQSVARRMQLHGRVSGALAAHGLQESLSALAHLHAELAARAQSEPVTGAGEWLLDNWYLARREGQDALRQLRGAQRLRAACSEEGKRSPVVLLLAEALVRAGRGEMTPPRCAAFLRGFQSALVLSGEELRLFVPALRAALIGHILARLRLAEDPIVPDGVREDMARAFGALRLLSTVDLSELLEQADRTEQILRQDPAGIYPQMDERTRASYRARVARLAARAGLPEHLAAEKALTLAQSAAGQARHVGWYLFREPLGAPENARRGCGYIAANVLLTLFFSLLMGFLTSSAACALLLLFPVSELIKNLLDNILLRVLRPTQVPRLELAQGIPPEGRTLCAVSALLTDAGSGKTLARRLEEYRLANRDAGEQLLFAILADLPETKRPELPGASDWLTAAAQAIDDLNRKYGGGFFLLGRERQKSERDGVYRGWERKRGALLSLMRYLREKESELQVLAGDAGALRGVAFVLALDADTRLTPGAAREMAGAMLHPLCRAELDRRRRIVTAGYGMLAPRMSVELAAASRSGFSRLFAGQGGTDPYGSCCGEVYMDAFGRGGFAGKGMIDVDAYLACMEDRIPENTVLSHDVLEGAYLRCAFAGDVELTDGFPSRPAAYFRRMERWIRGDWQNLPWLLRRGRDLPDIERWRVFDNLRRSLAAPLSFASLLAGFLRPEGALGWAAAAALVTVLSNLLLLLADAALRRAPASRIRFHSRVVCGVWGGLAQTAVRLLLLPAEAVVSLCAMLTALWRMLITHKNLLQWQTAAQADAAGDDGFRTAYRTLWPCAFFGVLCMGFAASVIGKTAGLLWLLAPLLARSLGRDAPEAAPPREAERRYLLDRCAEIWRYFTKFCTEEDNFLPPDNFQQSPPVGLAHRTSPTNIGLALLCALAADDLHIAPREKCLFLIEKMLNAAERLEKWHGHLYNWYDTRTLEKLRPAYVSTVDSGNLAACLSALAAGLREKDAPALAGRAEKLYAAMDFSPLLDRRRCLFHIGWDAERETLTEGWYDLLASEARLTAFVAIAKGDAPRRHWRRLSRAQLQKDGYRGMASWTGTMFEYLMPDLLTPCRRDSLLYESERFCLYCQKRRALSLGLPWGVSESAFAAFDPLLSYRYKAHGVQALALRRGMDGEYVVSPYSSFLALSLTPGAAVKNLQKLDALGARGAYGFWDAVDFTPARLGAGEDRRVVRCVMAHHLGMSMLAAANRLEGGVMRRRFLASPEMAAHITLLEEKVPTGGAVLRLGSSRVTAQRPRRGPAAGWEQTGDVDAKRDEPGCCVLSNGFYNVMLTETGTSEASCRSLLPYVGNAEPADGQPGLAFTLRDEQGEYPLFPGERWSYGADSARFQSECGDCSATVEAFVAGGEPGECRVVTVSHNGAGEYRCTLVLQLEAALCGKEDYVNHPAFYGLGLFAQTADGALTVGRLPRGRLEACALALRCSAPMQLCAVEDRGVRKPVGDRRWLVGGRLEASVELCFDGEARSRKVAFALCVAKTAEGASDAAARILRDGGGDRAALPAACAALLGLERGLPGAWALLRRIRFGTPDAQLSAGDRAELWALGISGDLPILYARVRDENSLRAAAELLRQHALLSVCAQRFDLAVLSPDGGDYRAPTLHALWNVLHAMERERALGARGGVHFLEDSPDNLRLLAGAGIAAFGEEPEDARDLSNVMSTKENRQSGEIPYHYKENGAFCFDASASLPPRAWSQILTNGKLGCVATDRGFGHVWLRNARQAQVLRWRGDADMTEGEESLQLIMSTESHDLFASPGDGTSHVEYDLGTAVWERRFGGARVRVTAFVPPEADCRILLLETEGCGGAKLLWRFRPLLAACEADRIGLRCGAEEGALWAENPRFPYPEARLYALCSATPLGIACDRTMDWSAACSDCPPGAGRRAELRFLLPAEGRMVLVAGFGERKDLQHLAQPETALRLLAETRRFWDRQCRSLTVRTPDETLDRYLNGWAVYQTLACRMLGRCSLYQSGGAYGFRDQLQDAVNLLPVLPGAARRQILTACAHQFREGDVQHWWHALPEGPRGVRTRCSDDLLWLPWAICAYMEAEDDVSLLREEAGFLVSAPLSPGEDNRYELPGRSEEKADVLEHGFRALELVMRRGTGRHGLLRMLGGDWNDGFDRVGAAGEGESVWLSWFFAHTAARFAALAERFGSERDRVSALRATGEAALRAADAAWDGNWYLRGFFDDGTPIGSAQSAACQIDSVAQSFSAFCEGADPERRERALQNAFARLLDREHGLVKLFTPPFAPQTPDPGYITSYGPGFRENGGQYTHGALWLAMALLRAGKTEEGWEVLRTLLPGGRDTARYGAEPYVVAADVYSAPGHEGQAGWSWYTGSAGWLLRVALCELIGLRREKGRWRVSPRLPAGWEGCTVELREAGGAVRRLEIGREGLLGETVLPAPEPIDDL